MMWRHRVRNDFLRKKNSLPLKNKKSEIMWPCGCNFFYKIKMLVYELVHNIPEIMLV